MNTLADILLIAGALATAFYCFILARRLRAFGDVKKGLGGAIFTLSKQVDDLIIAVNAAQTAARQSGSELSSIVDDAAKASRKLELLLTTAPKDNRPDTPATVPQSVLILDSGARRSGGKEKERGGKSDDAPAMVPQ